MKQVTLQIRKVLTARHAAKLAAGTLSLGAASAFAAIDTTAVQSGITAAQTSGESVGAMVIAAVAALAVIGLIIGIVRKL